MDIPDMNRNMLSNLGNILFPVTCSELHAWLWPRPHITQDPRPGFISYQAMKTLSKTRPSICLLDFTVPSTCPDPQKPIDQRGLWQSMKRSREESTEPHQPGSPVLYLTLEYAGQAAFPGPCSVRSECGCLVGFDLFSGNNIRVMKLPGD